MRISDWSSDVCSSDLASDSDTLFNWKLGVLYQPVEAASIYDNYALSQQPPGGANFQLTKVEGSANSVNADPQKAETYEIGGKWDVINERSVERRLGTTWDST